MMDVNFEDNSEKILSDFENALQKGLKAIGMTAEGHAKKETPVDTGRLRNSISHAETKDSTYIGTNVEYAPYIENGARGRKAHHMLQRAATQHSAEYKKIMEDSIKNA